MTLISIRERGITSTTPVVAIDGQEYPLPNGVTPPFDAKREAQLEWYFEEHLRFPFTNQVRAQTAAASIHPYGEALFDQVFGAQGNYRAYGRYQAALQQGIATLAFEIAGSPDFQQVHWEALKDPDLPQPFALQAPFVRRNLTPRTLEAQVRPSPTLNVLVVTARPGVGRDVGYRTISRPLVEALRQSGTPVAIDILRPGSYAALVAHLEEQQDRQGAGYYHVIHFDVHGGLLSFAEFDALEQRLETSHYTFQPARYGRGRLPAYAGVKAFLFLESGAPGVADPVEATELAQLLLTHQIPIAILNACQSAKYLPSRGPAEEADAEKADDAPPATQETSLGSQLMRAGLQMVLAMGYSVTVSAAEIMMTRLYQQLFQGGDLAAAIRAARLELHNRKGRRAFYNQQIELEDWLLPVVYQNQPQQLTTRPFTDAERTAYYERQAARYRPPHLTYGFVGRDLDILHIEQRLLRQAQGRDQNLLLVQGMGGAGKSTLLHHLAAWWQGTGLVDQVAYFGYDERAWTLQQILDALARQLLSERDYLTQFQPLSLAAQQQLLATRLRATRHLLILDNLESITGSNLAILNTLPESEQRALHHFLQELAGGKTLVLLGSRGPERWLAPGSFDANVYALPGLDAEAASTLADRILARHHATQYRADPAMQQDLARLIALLDGHPLALEVVLANLAKQTPGEVLGALQRGEAGVDNSASTEDKTKSILACIIYSHSNLSPDAQQLLLCLAPFTGVINREWLPQYTNHLITQSPLAHLPFDRWDEVLIEAINWGLLTTDHQMPTYLRIQPIFPYFLRTRLQENIILQDAIERAFMLHYGILSNALGRSIKSKDSQERQIGLALTKIEYENLNSSLKLSLAQKIPPYHQYFAMSLYLDQTQKHQLGLEFGRRVNLAIQKIGVSFFLNENFNHTARIIFNIGNRELALRYFKDATSTYQYVLSLTKSPELQVKDVSYIRAMTYHQLGNVFFVQRKWTRAEAHYQQALKIYIEFNDRYEQADTYHQLGMVAEEQRKWTQAEAHYQQVLKIHIEFNDRYKQAGTYHQLGNVAFEQQQWAQAEAHYRQALKIYIEFNDRYKQAGIYHQLGNVFYEQRQWAQAALHYQQALKIYIEFNDRYEQAGTYHNLGAVAQEQRQWAQAEQHYQQALALYIEFNDRYAQASTYHQLGMVAEEQEQWDQAREYLLQDLEITAEYNDEHGLAITLRSLARLHRAGGDATLPAAVAAILGIAPAEVAARFAQALDNDEA